MFLPLVQVQLIPSSVWTLGFHRDLKVNVDWCFFDRDTGLIAAVPSMCKGGKYFAYLTTELTSFVISSQRREIALRCVSDGSWWQIMQSFGYQGSLGTAAQTVVDLVRTHKSSGKAMWQ